MNFWEWLVSPHIHEWETIGKLSDRPRSPTATTIIQTCKICGDVRETLFRAPTGTAPPPVCPPHKWRSIGKSSVYSSSDKAVTEKTIPSYHIELMQCERCGERKDHAYGAGAPKA